MSQSKSKTTSAAKEKTTWKNQYSARSMSEEEGKERARILVKGVIFLKHLWLDQTSQIIFKDELSFDSPNYEDITRRQMVSPQFFTKDCKDVSFLRKLSASMIVCHFQRLSGICIRLPIFLMRTRHSKEQMYLLPTFLLQKFVRMCRCFRDCLQA